MASLNVFEVRYDDDEAYFVVALFTDKPRADRLRDRLAEAHMAADGDDCHLDSAWVVVRAPVDDTDPEIALPPDLFDDEGDAFDHHAGVNIDRLPFR